MTYDPAKASKAQEQYCDDNNYPHFAPNWRIGYRCYYCNRNIFEVGGVSVEEASTTLITGCPWCCHSFCD